VKFEGKQRCLPEVVKGLERREAFRPTREVEVDHRPGRQFVAEVSVRLHRPARHQRVIDGEKVRITVKGPPIRLRLVVTQVRDAAGALLAEWLLLTNVPASVGAEAVALWYHWRWRIESYFKLLKGAGYHLEQWRQHGAPAVAKRMLVAAMACVTVWEVARSERPEAQEVRELLVRLSGRQMGHGVSHTWPALLAGLWVLVGALEVLKGYDAAKLRSLLGGIWGTPAQQNTS
jgi:hypothetical protein